MNLESLDDPQGDARERYRIQNRLHDLFMDVALLDRDRAIESLNQINDYIGSVQGWDPYQYKDGYFTPTYITDSGMDFEDAIQCATDVERTRLLIQGVYANITRKLQSSQPEEPIVVVEAGPGTGILLLAATLFGEGRVSAIGLEINPKTKQKIDQLIESVQLTTEISILRANAAEHEFSDSPFIDIFISENLHTGGFNEPQDKIVSHLRKYMKTESVYIPEGIELSIQLAHCDYWNTTVVGTEAVGTEIEQDKIVNTYPVTPITNPLTYLTINYADKDVHAVCVEVALPGSLDPNIRVDTMVFYMDVFIGRDQNNNLICLPSGTARFLGVPHLVRLKNPIVPDGTKESIRIEYPLGSSPNEMNVTVNESGGE